MDAGSLTQDGASGAPGDLVMLEILKTLKDLQANRSSSTDDAPDGNQLDGLRVMKSLGRMRALRENLESNPCRVVNEYKEAWLRDLGAEGRAFRWHDTNRAVKWSKYTSMRKVHYMLCDILEILDQGKLDVGRAKTVQCMKSLQEFSRHGQWKVAWELTYMPDPTGVRRHGGPEAEVETILGFLKTRDDIDAKISRGMAASVSDEEGDTEKKKKAEAKKAAKPTGGG